MPDSNDPLFVADPCPVGTGDVLSGRYAIEHLVGEGTFGWVFSAVDVQGAPPRRVAIKLLRQRHSSQEEGVRRFERRELALLLRVGEMAPTPHVVRALEHHLLVHEGHPYLVLEFIEGPSLREVMDRRGLKTADIQRLGAELARGLAAIHSAGGVHRDLKPTNIRLRGGQQAVIVDLGINRALWDTEEVTVAGQALMTPRYASPEQGLRLDVGPASDVYSLGLILYELLTGDVPQGEDGLEAVLASRNVGSPLPRALREGVLRCLHPNPRRRPKASTLAVGLSGATGWGRRYGAPARWALVLAGVAMVMLLGSWFWSGASGRSRGDVPAAAHPREWSRSFPLPSDLKSVGKVRTDAWNNVLILGGFMGVMNFGGAPLERRDMTGLFLVKLDPEGRHLWSRALGQGSVWQWPTGLGTSPNGDVWIQGQFSGMINPGPGCPDLSSTGKDAFLARLNAEGQCLAALLLGGDGDQIPTRLVVTSDGGVVIGGSFTGQLKIGGETWVSSGPMDSFVARFSADGSLRWVRQFRSPKKTELSSLALGRTGDIELTGVFRDSLDLEGTSLAADGASSSFAARLDARGRGVWSQRVECGPIPEGWSLYTCAYTFDDDRAGLVLKVITTTEPRPAQLAFLTRLDAEGKAGWTRELGACERCYWTLLQAPDGRLLVSGWVEGRMDVGDGPFSALGGRDFYLLELTPEGELIRSRRFGNGLDLKLSFVTTDDQGDWILVGDFAGQLDFGPSRLTSAESRSLFVAHLKSQSVLPAARATCGPPPDGLVAWYSFEDPEPETSSAGAPAPPGRLQGEARLVPGRGGQVLFPNGGFFQVPDAAAFAWGRDSFSLSAWIRTSDADKIKLILDKREEPERTRPPTGYQLALDRGRVIFALGAGHDPDGGTPEDDAFMVYSSGRFVADGAWHHVAVTVERNASRGGTLYVDGEAVSRFNTTLLTGSLDTPLPLRVGSRSSEKSGLFRGLIDDVALWRRALSAEEVAGLHGSGRGVACESSGSDR